MLFVFCNTSFANVTDNASCQAQIINSAIAKASSNNQTLPPTVGWEKVNHFPDFSDTHWKTYSGHVWYKIQWNYNCKDSSSHPLTLVISYMKMAAKIYLNGDLLWQDKSLHEPLSRSWNTPRYWNIPTSAIKPGENTFLIYIANTATQKASLGNIHIGESAQVLPYYEKYLLKQRTLISIAFIISFTVGIFYFMVWLIYKKDTSYLWISITVLLWLSYSFLFLIQFSPLPSNDLDRLIAWLFSTYTIVSCIGIWRFAHRQFPTLEKLLLFLFIVSSLVIICVPQIYLVDTLKIIFLINMVIFLLQNITYPFIAYKAKLIEVYCLAVLRVSFIPISLHDAYQIITHQTEFWSPYTAPFSALVLGIILGLRIYRTKTMIENFNQTLTKKITQVTEELSASLNDQHQLALKNIRLQERISLSHDLHDGLGSSLVRSIALVDHSSDLDKQQFLSILKLLRNDLRQVIDSGSSLSTHIPDSPIMWAASIRRRFVQIFEELDIKSTWQLEDTWLIKPTNLQCLTLSRIIEEALTNVLKHSRANFIKVVLIQTDEHVILEIHDNGIGFDPQTVENGLHVGLQSMQARVNRIGGTFKIHSKSGNTVIQVKLNHI